MLSKAIIASLIFVSTAAFAAEGAMKQDAAEINTACSADAATASCGSEQVGTGLLKCLHAYKKANKGFKFSSTCHAAMGKMHADHKAMKKETK